MLTSPSLLFTHTQNLIFRFLQSRTRVQIWLFEQTDLRIEGQIIVSGSVGGRESKWPQRTFSTLHPHLSSFSSLFSDQGFDEYMNLVLDEADEVSAKRGTRKPLGRILLKGDTITLMRPIVAATAG